MKKNNENVDTYNVYFWQDDFDKLIEKEHIK